MTLAALQTDAGIDEVASALQQSVSLFLRQLRGTKADGDDLSLSERSALARLERMGSATSAELARGEQISPQSMGATIATLEERDLVARAADPTDGRRVLLSATRTGKALLRSRRTTRVQQTAEALRSEFTPAEIRRLHSVAPLIERLAAAL